MCGRFTLSSPGELIAELLGLDLAPELAPRYNIAPTQPIAVVRHRHAATARELAWLRWGLVPASGRRLPRPLINARAEGVADRPMFREAVASRRCLVPADGFYEWRSLPGIKRRQPYLVRRRDGRPFAFAGLWEPAIDSDVETDGTCTILTTEPTPSLARLHDRMPVILAPQALDGWLDTRLEAPGELEPLLRGLPDDALTLHPVGPWVNDPRNDVPSCVAPLGA